jgi:signal transduction histidine kinase
VTEPLSWRLQKSYPTSEATSLRTLNTFAVDLIAIPNVEELFWYVALNVVGKMGFVDCVVYQADQCQTSLTQVAAWGEKNPFGREIISPLVIPFGLGITGHVAQTKTAIIIDDLREDQNYISDTLPARSEICVPLICHGTVVGVIDCEHPEPSAFGHAELEILTTVAAMTSAKLVLLAETERSIQRYHDLTVSHAQLTQEISNRKALEADLFEARKLEAIGRLTGRFAHEFNNIMTVISGHVELLEIDRANLESNESSQHIRTAASRGEKLIKDMLAFAQRTHLAPSDTNLNTLISAFCTTQSTTSSTSVNLTLADDLWVVSVDPKTCEQAFANLFLNACDSMAQGGSLEITTENISHFMSSDQEFATRLLPGSYVRLSVRDSGIGIPKNLLMKIFDPFYTTKMVGRGVGLGLSMVLGFMRQSGGAVAVQSDVGKGSTFHLYFPISHNDVNALLTLNS